MEPCRLCSEGGPYRFFFYAGDRNESPHVHVGRDDGEAKFWLEPVRLEHSYRFRSTEIHRIQRLVEEHQQLLLESWDEFFRG
jgi:hypothetical protein